MVKIGLIGCGNIGQFLLENININRTLDGFRIEALLDEREDRWDCLKDLSHKYRCQPCNDISSFVLSNIDLVIEAANIEVVRKYFPDILSREKDVLPISIGALADQDFYLKLKGIAHTNGRKIFLPSGAIGGLDILKSASSTGQIDSVILTTRKPPLSLIGRNVDQELEVYSGPADEAIKQFSKNVNVSIILSLAGIGTKKTTVNIIADPKIEKNIHQIKATGKFGQFSLTIENEPMPGNPKTSYLAALSILSTLKDISDEIRIG